MMFCIFFHVICFVYNNHDNPETEGINGQNTTELRATDARLSQEIDTIKYRQERRELLQQMCTASLML